MTQQKAETVAAALINAGRKPRVLTQGDDWIIIVSDDDGVLINTLKNFQDNHSVTIRTNTAIIS